MEWSGVEWSGVSGVEWAECDNVIMALHNCSTHIGRAPSLEGLLTLQCVQQLKETI